MGRVKRRPAVLGRALLLLLVAGLLVAALIRLGRTSSPVPRGSVRLTVLLPPPLLGQSQPLLTTGHEGAGDFVYLKYVDRHHIVVGHDKWASGGAVSAPIAVDYDKPQVFDVTMTSLGSGGGGEEAGAGASALFCVKLNGGVALSEKAAAYPSRPEEITVGENRIGGSTTGAHFGGDIIGVELPTR